MFKIPFLRNILLIAFLFAAVFPIYHLCFIIPSYQDMLLQETERAVAQFARFLVVSNRLEKIELNFDRLPPDLGKEVGQLKSEGTLEKLRLFSPSGKIVFSTVDKEIGTVNKNIYFREVVAKGHFYSKVVHKASVTAEGAQSDRDLVETYVPIMAQANFHGAIEVYSDISRAQENLTSLSRKSFSVLLSASLGLLLLTLMVLFNARNSIAARDHAEFALQQVNEDLESRVGQRTIELLTANQRLIGEVSERKKAQLAQKTAFIATCEAHDRIDSIVKSVADALLVTDHQDSILLINPAAEALFKVKADEVVGCRLPDVIGYDEMLLEISKARTQLRLSDAVDFDFSLNRDGNSRVYQGRASRLRESAANIRGLILLVHDVTRERQIDKMKSEFVSMAAHELQTPLTMILGYSELMLDVSKNFSSAEKRDFLQIINDKSVELSCLIDNILDLSHIEDGGGLQLKFSRIDVGSLCRQLVANFAGSNGYHEFDLQSAQDEIWVDADSVRLTQVFENLIGNAVKYSPNGGLIRVVLDKDENGMQLDIIDQGIGMSTDEKASAFDRFYRADASNTAVRGTGLGLSISKYIIDAHGGKIAIFSEKGKGTRLEVRLPLLHE